MTRFWFKQFLMFFFSLSQKIISTLSLKNCKNLKTSLFKCLEHSFLISRSIQNLFLKSFLWPTLNLDGLEGFVSHSQKTVSFSSLKNLQKSEKFPFQMLKTFFSELKVASKPFSKKLLMTKFWFKHFLMSCLTFPESGINFVTRKLQKTEIFFQILRTFVFDLKVASEPFSNKLLMTLNSNDFEGSVLLSQKTFSTSSHKNLQKTEKYSFQTLRTFVFELKVASKPFSKKTNSFPENDFNFVNQKFAKNRKLLRKWFWSFLELKNKYCGRLKIAFFYHFWESEARCSKLFKFKVGHRMHSRKWLWSYLELKTDCSECLKKTLLSYCEVLGDEVETTSWKSDAKRQKLFKLKFGYKKLLRKWFWSYSELKNECSERLKRAFFVVFFQIIEWQSWNHSLGKWAKVRETV